jgi:hypothetical protein
MRFYSHPLVIIAVIVLLTSCTYSRSQVTLIGTPAPSKAATFEPAILDRMPQGKVQVVAEGSKGHRDLSWAKDACRDLGCDAAVITGRRPRQVANLIQTDASVNGSPGRSAPQTHTVFDEYFYQFVILP